MIFRLAEGHIDYQTPYNLSYSFYGSAYLGYGLIITMFVLCKMRFVCLFKKLYKQQYEANIKGRPAMSIDANQIALAQKATEIASDVSITLFLKFGVGIPL